MVLRRSLEVSVPTDLSISSRLPSALVPCTDALALLLAAAATGFRSTALAYGVLTAIALNIALPVSSRINPRLGDDFGWLFGRLGACMLVVLPIATLVHERVGELLLLAVSATILIPAGRGVAYGIQRRLRARGVISERALIVGTGEVGVELARILDGHPEYGLRPIGLVGDPGDRALPVPVLGYGDDLEQVVREQDVRRVVVAYGGGPDPQLVRILRRCESLPVEILVVPRFFELNSVPVGPSLDDAWGIPLVHVRRPTLQPPARIAKRAFDLVVGSMIVVLVSPVMLVAAGAVRLSSPGPLLFRQRRIGFGGREFEILKFRSMRVNDDSDTHWAVDHDDRVTPAGRLLRRTGIDELPQLFNVLKGQMSLVGPRPERPLFAERFGTVVPGYTDRHRVPVGLTGWAQIHGLRGDTSIPDRARFDNDYIEHWSLWLDVMIIVRTIWLVFKGTGR
jgi:exopolysaccharide biosynthesis polyprenyl glycosylphosphotransferase